MTLLQIKEHLKNRILIWNGTDFTDWSRAILKYFVIKDVQESASIKGYYFIIGIRLDSNPYDGSIRTDYFYSSSFSQSELNEFIKSGYRKELLIDRMADGRHKYYYI